MPPSISISRLAARLLVQAAFPRVIGDAIHAAARDVHLYSLALACVFDSDHNKTF